MLSRCRAGALAVAAFLVVLALAPASGHASAKADRLCDAAFPQQFSRTYDIRFGTKTIYNRDLSRGLVCSGAFGAPDGYRATFGAACSLALAAYKVKVPKGSRFAELGCFSAEVSEDGVPKALRGKLCGFLVDVVGTGVGVLTAGYTLNPAVGVATWKGVTFAGDAILCIGIANVAKDARSWGIKLEGRHETNVARDIVTQGKCLQQTKRRVVGIQWSAIDCPNGFTGSTLPAPSGGAAPQPSPTPSPDPPAAAPDPAPAPGPAPAPVPAAPAPTWAETTGGPTNTWTNWTNAGGQQGPTIPAYATVQIACKLPGFRVASGNTWWYRIAQGPWNGQFYASADAFYNNGQTSGSLRGTPFVDPAVADC